jgi:hypothetical protein
MVSKTRVTREKTHLFYATDWASVDLHDVLCQVICSTQRTWEGDPRLYISS